MNISDPAVAMLQASSVVKESCKELFKNTAITSFGYLEVFQDGSYVSLCSDIKLYEAYMESGLLAERPLSILNAYPTSGYYLLDTDNTARKKSEGIVKLLNSFSYAHPFRIIERNEKESGSIFRSFGFEAHRDNDSINHYYINNIEQLNDFNTYFTNFFAEMLHRLPRLTLTLAEKKIFYQQLMQTPIKKTSDKASILMSEPTLKESDAKKANLSQREQEVVYWCMLGKTAEETALILNLSKRTIERHFERIRTKLNCYSKLQIIRKALTNDLLGHSCVM